MSDFGFGGGSAAIVFSDATPAPEATAGAAGTVDAAARGNHTHPRLTSATVQALDTNGLATITFTRKFTALPAVTCLLYEAGAAQPVVFKVQNWIQDANNNYTGCVIQGARASVLPALSGILLVGPLISTLANYNVFGGSAAGAQFCCIALQPSN